MSSLERSASRLRTELRQREEAVRRLDSLLEKARADGGLGLDDLLRTLETVKMFEKYYTPQQMEQLKARAAVVGEERIREVEQEWQDLFARYREAMERGAEPASEEVQALARKSRSLIEEFTGGDAGIEQSLLNMYASEGAEKVAGPHGVDTDASRWSYVGSASRALERSED